MMDSYHTARNCHPTGLNHENANRRVDSLIRTNSVIRTLEMFIEPRGVRITEVLLYHELAWLLGGSGAMPSRHFCILRCVMESDVI